ncbi:MAG: C2H2-type zinc finger protein [Thermoproteota archaeon]
MITVDCREAEHLKHELAVFVSDWLGAIPSIKLHEFVLSPLENEGLDGQRVIKAIKEFFASIGETANYGVLSKDNLIFIKSLHEAPMQKAKPTDSMFACAHCGYVTPYEVLWQNHMKMHYL